MKNFVPYILLISTVLILIFSSNNVKREKLILSYDQQLKEIKK